MPVRWITVVVLLLAVACSGSSTAPRGSRLDEVGAAAGCRSVEVVGDDPGFTDTGTCDARGEHVRVDINEKSPMSGLVARFSGGGIGATTCRDGTPLRPAWIAVGEGWMVMASGESPVRAAAETLGGEVLADPAERGTPISFEIGDADLVCRDR